ncbi:glycosyltransferase family 4 protein [Undibacterium sp. Ren11W]|uniref:glycosyltransferase family 4 protein n=1 Tax=Undibacterium sp. Ren11W TaxID=3413045 RepID=UPI003BF200C9
MKSKIALMVCTQSRGGMRSVVDAYERDGVFQRWCFESLWTHCAGSAGARVRIAASAYCHLLSLLIRRKISFLHIHAAMRGSFWRKSLIAETARCFGVPSIIHLHGSDTSTFHGTMPVLRHRAVRRSLEKAAAVVVLSESWREFVLQVAPRARITVLNNYVLLPTLTLDKTDHEIFSLLFLGVITQRKGIFDLLECWPAVLAKIPGARLSVGGTGDMDEAKALVEKLGIAETVKFLGWVDGDHKLDLLKQADALVLPSYNEGLPMSVLEAMSWGKPVVTTRVGGIPELICDGESGLLVDAGDQSQLANALIKLGSDAHFRQLIGASGRARIEHEYSDVAVLPRLEAIYQNLSTPIMKAK